MSRIREVQAPQAPAQPAVSTAADGWADFFGPNAGYVVELYDSYVRDPSTVDPQTRAAFDAWRPPSHPQFQDARTPAQVGTHEDTAIAAPAAARSAIPVPADALA